MPVLAPRLAAHSVLATTDVDLARERVAGALCPHTLTPHHDGGSSQDAEFSLRHHRAGFGDVSVHWIDYAAGVEVRVEAMPFVLVQVPLAGVATATDGSRREGTAGAGSALVCGPGAPWRMRYSAGTPRVMLQVPQPLAHRRWEMAGLSATGRAADPVLDLSAGPGAAFGRLLRVVLDDLEAPDGGGSVPLATRTLALALVDALVSAQHAAAGGGAPTPRSTASRDCVERAVRYAEDHCGEPLTTTDLAAAVGVGVRALQTGYAQHLGETPSAHLRRVRLQRVREDLSDGTAATVTDAATRWGLTHLGRLSVQYREAFGESPSQTLRRAR